MYLAASEDKTRKSRRRSIADCLAALILVACLVACHTYTATTRIERGTRIDEGKVAQIEVGRSTRGDVFRLFGAPHSEFSGGATVWTAEHVGFYSYAEGRPVDSMDANHYALLYRFATTDTHITQKTGTWSSSTEHAARFLGDELLIILDKQSHTVRDVAHRTRE
ncbi:MAG: hypothetical protein ACYS0G_12975 [Planctomycetota bacterium]|jgi:hypothetical protein